MDTISQSEYVERIRTIVPYFYSSGHLVYAKCEKRRYQQSLKHSPPVVTLQSDEQDKMGAEIRTEITIEQVQ